MAKVPLVPAYMKEYFDSWARPDGPEPVAPTEEENILIAEGLADQWNGRCIAIEVLERRVRNRLRRDKRRRLREAEANARLAAAAANPSQTPAPGPTAEAAGQPKPATRTRAPRQPRSGEGTNPRTGNRSSRARRVQIESDRAQLGLGRVPQRPRRS
jgi:hypothetical protein